MADFTPIPSGSASAFDVTGGVTEITATLGAPVSIGDTICAAAGHDLGGTATSGKVTDNLGNSWQQTAAVINDTTNNYRNEAWFCIVTVAGTPIVKLQFFPTPGTTTAPNSTLAVDPFTGSDANSAGDGSNKANNVAPGAGADLVTSGLFSTTKAKCLVYAACTDTSTGADPGTVGTGFTGLQITNASGVRIRTEYKVQSSIGSTAGTFTAAGGSSGHRFNTVAFAVSPKGAGQYTDQPRRDMAIQQRAG